jgi:hypothetical protein
MMNLTRDAGWQAARRPKKLCLAFEPQKGDTANQSVA